MDEHIKYREQLFRRDLDSLRAEYLAERHQVSKDRYAAAQDFDKALLTLSASSLGFSVAILNWIESPIKDEFLIQISWVMFMCAVMATVLALFLSYHAFDQEIKDVDLKYQANVETCLATHEIGEVWHSGQTSGVVSKQSTLGRIVTSAKKHLPIAIETANVLAVLLLFSGVICLVCFGNAQL